MNSVEYVESTNLSLVLTIIGTFVYLVLNNIIGSVLSFILFFISSFLIVNNITTYIKHNSLKHNNKLTKNILGSMFLVVILVACQFYIIYNSINRII